MKRAASRHLAPFVRMNAMTPRLRTCALALATTFALVGARSAEASNAPEPTLPVTRYIVTYKTSSLERQNHQAVLSSFSRALVRALPATQGVRASFPSVIYLRKLGQGSDLVRISRSLGAGDTARLLSELQKDPAVAGAQPDTLMHAVRDIRAPAPNVQAAAATAAFPDDPGYSNYQWHLRAGDGQMETVGRDSHAFANLGGSNIAKAWSLADGQDVTVAVIDTGLTHHPDLDTSLGDAGYDFISSGYISGRSNDDRAAGGWDTGDWTTDTKFTDPNTGCISPQAAEDSSWHGTHVSGTISELTGNAMGMAGTAFHARVLPIRALGHCGGYTSDIADAIVWASGGHIEGVPDNAHPAKVISMSLGGNGQCGLGDITASAVADAIGRGSVIVVAAGNANDNAAAYTPASCPGVISVAAVGITGSRAFYSNFGTSIALAAPGGGAYANDAATGELVDAGFVWSTINTGLHEADQAGYAYGGMAGTSQATPHVAGVVALMMDAASAAGQPVPTAASAKAMLRTTTRLFPAKPPLPIGSGILDAFAAVSAAAGVDVQPSARALTKGVPQTGLGMPTGASLVFTIDVPAGARNLTMRSSGGTGNATLLVKMGSVPKADGSDADIISAHPGNAESAIMPAPVATTYYMRLVAVQDVSSMSVLATYVP